MQIIIFENIIEIFFDKYPYENFKRKIFRFVIF